MLLDLRETVRNSKPIKYTLITIICIPFVLFGVGSYFTGGGDYYAAKVDGEEIGMREFDNAYRQQRQRLAQMFGGSIPEGFADESAIRQQALDGLLTQQVMRNTVAENNFTVSDATLAKAISGIPQFQNNGAFDKERYEMQLRSSGMSVEAFENSYREDTALAQFRSGLVDTAFQLPNELEALNALQNQVRNVDTIRFELAPVKEGTEVSEEEIQAWFDDNADTYIFPKRVKIQYIDLSVDSLAAAIDVTDDDAVAYFENNKGNYLLPEERKASHILLALDDGASDSEIAEKTAQLEEIKGRVEAGEEFAALAVEFSEDAGSAQSGGSLGAIAPGAMVPAFERAVFGLADADDLSDPIKTEFGVHLIKLDEIVPEKGETFEQAKSEVIEAIRSETAQREYFDLSDVLIEQAFDNPDSLEAAADATGLEIKESDWLDGSADTPAEFSNPLILRTALSADVLQDENNSEALELGANHIMVLRTQDYEDERPKALEDVRDDISDTLKTNKAGEVLDASLASARDGLTPDADLLALAEANSGELSANLAIGRRSSELDREVVSQLFKLSKPVNSEPVIDSQTLANGDRLLVVFRGTNVANPLEEASTEGVAEGEALTNDQADTGAEGVASAPEFDAANPRLGNAEFNILLKTLRESADIETNDQAMIEQPYQY